MKSISVFTMAASMFIALAVVPSANASSSPMDNLAKDATKLVNDTANVLKDTAISTQINAKIALDKNLSQYDIEVNSNNGNVTLAGTVNSDSEASSLIQLAASTAGVKSVNATKLTVKSSDQPFSDMAITTKVKTKFLEEKLFGEKNVPMTSISVETKNGVVYLSGTADNANQIQTAIKLAGSVSGVSRVESTVVTVNK